MEEVDSEGMGCEAVSGIAGGASGTASGAVSGAASRVLIFFGTRFFACTGAGAGAGAPIA